MVVLASEKPSPLRRANYRYTALNGGKPSDNNAAGSQVAAIQDRIDNLAHRRTPTPAARSGSRHMRLDQLPVFLGKIASLSQALTAITPTGDVAVEGAIATIAKRNVQFNATAATRL